MAVRDAGKQSPYTSNLTHFRLRPTPGTSGRADVPRRTGRAASSRQGEPGSHTPPIINRQMRRTSTSAKREPAGRGDMTPGSQDHAIGVTPPHPASTDYSVVSTTATGRSWWRSPTAQSSSPAAPRASPAAVAPSLPSAPALASSPSPSWPPTAPPKPPSTPTPNRCPSRWHRHRGRRTRPARRRHPGHGQAQPGRRASGRLPRRGHGPAERTAHAPRDRRQGRAVAALGRTRRHLCRPSGTPLRTAEEPARTLTGTLPGPSRPGGHHRQLSSNGRYRYVPLDAA